MTPVRKLCLHNMSLTRTSCQGIFCIMLLMLDAKIMFLV